MKILKTRSPYYEAMKSGEKKLTGRAGDSSVKNYFEMDIKEKIRIQHVDDSDNLIEGEYFEAEVKKMTKYNTPNALENALEHEKVENLLPGVTSIEEAVKIYNSFPDYKKRIENHGFVVIELK